MKAKSLHQQKTPVITYTVCTYMAGLGIEHGTPSTLGS